MKKVLLSGVVLVLASCSAYYDMGCGCNNEYDYEYEQCDCGCANAQENVVVTPAVYEPEAVETDPCKCSNVQEDTRPILHPRITVEVKAEDKRNCPLDNQTLNCGCGECKTFENAEKEINDTPLQVVPDMPRAYELAASRVFNDFIKNTTDIYSQKPNVLLYLKPTELKDDKLPGGAKQGLVVLKNKILSSFTFAVTDDEKNNDYYLETTADWFDTPSKTVPAIKYVATLYDNKNNKIGQWVEIVKKVENSEQWL